MSDNEELKQAQTIAALERRLAAVEDAQSIQNLKARYGQLADSRYASDRSGPLATPELDRIAREITTLFSEDAVWDGGGSLGICRGRDEIYERFRKPTLQFSWHYFVKPQIQVNGDTARATWDILAPCTTSEGRPMWMAGTEDDEYVKLRGEWLHSSMRLSVVFMAPHDRGWAPTR
jgi:hypothetical protein